MTLVPASAALLPAAITGRSGSNFLAGFVCMAQPRREAMVAIYAYCRVVDDAVDDAPSAEVGRAHLAFWRAELVACANGAAQTPVGQALQAAMQRFGTFDEPLHGLLQACERDLHGAGFADEAELRAYCHGVASCVGRACLPVFGVAGPTAVRFADALGQALQWTNVLRDLHADARVGRVYAPRTLLAACGVAPAWLLADEPPAAAQAPLQHLAAQLAAVAQSEFALARAALRELPFNMRRALVPARIMGAVYHELLRALMQRGGRIHGPRVRVSKWRKLALMIAVWSGLRA